MRKFLSMIAIMATFVACGPSQSEFNALQNENEQLRVQVDSLKTELEAYKYSPDKLLVDAIIAAETENKDELTRILSQIKSYHPEAKECKDVQKLLDSVVAKEQARAKAEQLKAEKEKQERLKAVKKLKKKHDDVQNITWYYNPYFKHYNDKNLVSLYMGETSSSVWLRLKMSYTGDDWIFFDQAFLSYDGRTREFNFDRYQDKKSDNYGGTVWEWIDISVNEYDLAYLKEMVNGKSVKVRLSGKYSRTRTLTSSEIKAIKEMIMAYEVLKAEK